MPIARQSAAARWRQPAIRAFVAAAVALTVSSTVAAQTGTVTFSGLTNVNGALPVASYSGPALAFSSQVRTGFGNTAAVTTADARWWTANYSGQGMVYGNNSTLGNVLEVSFTAGTGFNLSLTEALFGGWSNRAANITYQLFNGDYSQTTGPFTVFAGATTPANPAFATNGWGNIIRLQFTETNSSGAPAGRGSFDVGVQGIKYALSPVTTPPTPGVVPEPSTYALMGTGLVMLGVTARRRRATRLA